MTICEIKKKIQELADQKYKGGYRYFKKQLLIDLIGKEGYSEILKRIDKSLHYSHSLLVYCFMTDILTHPKCKCGGDLKFNKTTKEFMKYCSNKCRFDNFSETIDARKKSNLDKYGSTNYLASTEGKEKIKKTNMERYGVDNYTKTQEYKDKYSGRVLTDAQKETIRNKIQEKYYYSLTTKYPQVIPLFSLNDYVGVKGYIQYPWYCKKCNKNFRSSIDNGTSPQCQHCKPKGSDLEIKIRELLNSMNIEHLYRYRGLPSGREIDFYIPSQNIGLELHGLYWHSTAGPNYSKKDHISKLEECESNGIKLISIYSDEIHHKYDIVRSRLKHILQYKTKNIYARKCKVNPITTDISNNFLKKYHMQGPVGSSIKLGLFYKNRLVAVMTFNGGRYATGHKKNDTEFELVRYCTIKNFTIVGGAGKLLKYFKSNYSPTIIYSYADRRWSDGNLYTKLGFDFHSNTPPNYWYTKDFRKRLNRLKFQKNKLVNSVNYSSQKTEETIMKEDGYYRTWDCGSKKFVMNIN